MQGRRVDFSEREGPRLPSIAPRYDPESLSSISRSALATPPSRTRLPPRSKNGCWTCRKRKVKCDELKPNCGQCSRLDLDCDYEQRLAFRNENQKVFDKEPNVIAASSPVWNPALYTPPPGLESSRRDSLPVFTVLTTDEDRERKAELHKPGTFLVLTGPSSFEGLLEYQRRRPTIPSGKLPHATKGSQPRRRRAKKVKVETQAEPWNDPNILFLDAFEDPGEALPRLSGLHQARTGGQDAHLLEHYRSSISRRIIKVGSQDVDEDVFELEARTCPPLFHAMMAISALSLAQGAGYHHAEALEHYQQVLPAMRDCFVRSEEDSNSDGAFFTHYLLLLYDIASAGPWESNMWQSHSNALQKIIARRRQVYRTEPHGFLVWIICLVDTYALLSGSGDGAFTNFILKNEMLSPRDCLPPLRPGQYQSLFQEELPFFPGVSELIQEVLDLATRVGGTARDLRAKGTEAPNAKSDLSGEHPFVMFRRRRVREIRDLCRSLPTIWQAKYPKYWSLQPSPKSLPTRVRGFCDHIYALYRACIIYSYTSMYPGQMGENIADEEKEEVSGRVTQLIQLAKEAVAEERWDLQYIPFCLFLAGVASEDKDEKALALKLLLDLEHQSHGANIANMRRLLRGIYDKKDLVAASGAQQFRIDWVDEMRNSGLMLVMFSV